MLAMAVVARPEPLDNAQPVPSASAAVERNCPTLLRRNRTYPRFRRSRLKQRLVHLQLMVTRTVSAHVRCSNTELRVHGRTGFGLALCVAQSLHRSSMLIDGQENFGSIDGDPPAAIRYTECRMHKLSSDLLTDLDKGTVDWQLNYDDKEMEPCLLLNGSSGIAAVCGTLRLPRRALRALNLFS